VTEVAPQHRRRSDLLLRLPRGGVGCEVGAWKGDFSAELLRIAEPSELHLVDPWLSVPDSGEWYARPQHEMDQIHGGVVRRFADDRRVFIHRMPSLNAAATFRDQSLDWVYVDAAHVYEDVLADLHAWWPKVKPGGVLCGDDYDDRHYWGDAVVRAVADFCDEKPARQVGIAGDQFWLEK